MPASGSRGISLQQMNQITERIDQEQVTGAAATFAPRFARPLPPGVLPMITFRVGHLRREALRSPRWPLAAVLLWAIATSAGTNWWRGWASWAAGSAWAPWSSRCSRIADRGSRDGVVTRRTRAPSAYSLVCAVTGSDCVRGRSPIEMTAPHPVAPRLYRQPRGIADAAGCHSSRHVWVCCASRNPAAG